MGPFKDVLDILEQLPDVILIDVPLRKGIRGIQLSSIRTDQRVEGDVIEDYLLEDRFLDISTLIKHRVDSQVLHLGRLGRLKAVEL